MKTTSRSSPASFQGMERYDWHRSSKAKVYEEFQWSQKLVSGASWLDRLTQLEAIPTDELEFSQELVRSSSMNQSRSWSTASKTICGIMERTLQFQVYFSWECQSRHLALLLTNPTTKFFQNLTIVFYVGQTLNNFGQRSEDFRPISRVRSVMLISVQISCSECKANIEGEKTFLNECNQ